MEDLTILFMERMKPSTAALFSQRLDKVCKGLGLGEVSRSRLFFIHDTQRVEDWISDPRNLHSRNGPSTIVSVTTKKNYYNALQAGARVVIPYKQETYDFYQNKTHDCNAQVRETAYNQTLDNAETQRWPTYVEFMRNLEILDNEHTRKPWDDLIHLKWLLYSLYDSLKDTCVLRLDVVYTVRFGETDDEDVNYLEGNKLVFNNYKTSDKYGQHVITLPTDMANKFKESWNEWPRDYLFPRIIHGQMMNIPMHQSEASKFVKSAWILSDSNKSPTADDVRSCLTTRFFHLNPDIMTRDRFARMSMSSRPLMEMYYYKVHESDMF